MNFDWLALDWGSILAPSVLLALVIFVALQLGKQLGVVGEDDFARIANIVMAGLLSGVSPDSPESIVLMMVSSFLAAVLYKIYAWIAAKYFKKEDEVVPKAGAY